MRHHLPCVFVLFILCLTGCAKCPTKHEFLRKETECLQYYCLSNAPAAEAALIELDRYAHRCQEAGVKGILYEEVFARINGRLYLLGRHLRRSKGVEQHLERYAYFAAVSRRLARQTNAPPGEMLATMEHELDQGLRTAWRTQ